MPAPGDQYGDVKNPFESRCNDKFSSEDAVIIQARLNKQLGPEYISQRPGNGGGKVAYLEGNKAIALANEMFGFDGWSSSLGHVQVDFVDENAQTGKVSLGLSIVVRITLKSGTFHEDIGYGSIENGKGKAASFEKAKKEAATDGLKRALRTFGNALGNCLYDKDYLKKVQAMKVKPVKFNEENLHRHPDFAPPPRREEPALVKREQLQTPAKLNQPTSISQNEHVSGPIVGEFDDEFDGNLFDGVEISENNGDDFTFEQPSLQALEPANSAPAHRRPPINQTTQNHKGVPQQPPNQRMQTATSTRAHTRAPPTQHPLNGIPQHTSGRPQSNQQSSRGPQTPVVQHTNSRPDLNRPRALPATVDIHAASNHQHGLQQTNQQVQQAPQNQSLRPTPPQAQQSESKAQGTTTPAADLHPSVVRPHIGFVTSRAAEMVQNSESASSITGLPSFNPQAESPVPKAQRTPGIDHTRSIPVKRGEIAALPPPALHVSNLTTSNASDSNSGGGGLTHQGIATAMPRGGGNINFANPQQDMNRRIGMPGGGGSMSPSINRSAYRPPIKRPPLQDVSNSNQRNDAATGEPAPKKLKTDAGNISVNENANTTCLS